MTASGRRYMHVPTADQWKKSVERRLRVFGSVPKRNVEALLHALDDAEAARDAALHARDAERQLREEAEESEGDAVAQLVEARASLSAALEERDRLVRVIKEYWLPEQEGWKKDKKRHAAALATMTEERDAALKRLRAEEDDAIRRCDLFETLEAALSSAQERVAELEDDLARREGIADMHMTAQHKAQDERDALKAENEKLSKRVKEAESAYDAKVVKVVALKAESARLRKALVLAQAKVDALILETPTGETRNRLTEINIALLSARAFLSKHQPSVEGGSQCTS